MPNTKLDYVPSLKIYHSRRDALKNCSTSGLPYGRHSPVETSRFIQFLIIKSLSKRQKPVVVTNTLVKMYVFWALCGNKKIISRLCVNVTNLFVFYKHRFVWRHQTVRHAVEARPSVLAVSPLSWGYWFRFPRPCVKIKILNC